NLTGMKEWATGFGWNTYPSLSALIPPGKVPSYSQSQPSQSGASFPVSDSILLSIWNQRPDLQKTFPEAVQGNLTGMKEWATNFMFVIRKKLQRHRLIFLSCK